MLFLFEQQTMQAKVSFLEYTSKNESYKPICYLNVCKFAYPCSQSNECSEINVTLNKGLYSLEVFGAQGGGDGPYDSKKIALGGYSYAIVNISNQQKFLLFIGAQGISGFNTSFNGGVNYNDYGYWFVGGGATDFRTDFNNNTRFLIAGGAAFSNDAPEFEAQGGGYREKFLDIEDIHLCRECSGGGGLYETSRGRGGIGYVHSINSANEMINSSNFPEILDGDTFFGINTGNGRARITRLDQPSCNNPTIPFVYSNLHIFQRKREKAGN